MNINIHKKERFVNAKDALARNDYGACVEVFNEFAERGDIASAAALGKIYFCGGGGVAKNYFKARYWLEQVDNFIFSPFASYKLGMIYYNGKGVDVDYKKAYTFFRKLALKKFPRGLVMVGLMHKNHEGVLFKPRLAQICFYHAMKSSGLNLIEKFFTKMMLLSNSINLVRYPAKHARSRRMG